MLRTHHPLTRKPWRSLSAILLGSTVLGSTLVLSLGALSPSDLLTPAAIAQTSADEQTGINVYRIASPAVVTIQAGQGSGSGSIISSDGLVLTNAHVIRNARSGRVLVNAANGQRYEGRVIAADRRNDLALVQIQTRDRLPTIRFGKLNDLAVGQRVYAIGSPFGLSGTFTNGILSRIDPETGILQTDAAINPGNSGGPLLNSKGELIGVNTAILSPGGRGGNIGIGFASNVAVAERFIASASRGGTPGPGAGPGPIADRPNNLRLGVALRSGDFAIQQVQAGSLAARVGLRPGDRIVAVNGRRLRDVDQLSAALTPDSEMVLTIARNRRLADVLIRL